MKNDYHVGDTTISVPPTLLFSVMAHMPDVRRAVTMDVKHPDDLVFVLGETRAELGGSEYYTLHGAIGNRVPQVDAPRYRGTEGGMATSAALVEYIPTFPRQGGKEHHVSAAYGKAH
jgi:phosphoribosylformylglycinamidine (FGAM) synthase-like enzyme